MCGNHSSDGTPIDHHHHVPSRIFYPKAHARSRRKFLGNLGKGTMAAAVISPALLAACSSDGTPSSTAVDSGTDTATAPTTAPTTAPADPTAAPADDPTAAPQADPTAEPEAAAPADDAQAAPAEGAGSDLVWARTNLGFVSAYVLVRGNTAAIVDTGVAGSAAAIGQTLVDLGLNYSDVEHVILTHNHSDHAGSITEVLTEAVNATAYAGEADLGSIPGNISPVVDGQDVFGFCLLYTSPSPRDATLSRMPSSA